MANETLFKIEVDAKDALAKIQQLKELTAENKKEMSEAQKEIVKNTEAIDANAKSIQKLRNEQQATSEALEDLSKIQKENGKLTEDQQKQYDDLSKHLDETTISLDAVTAKNEDLTQINNELSAKTEELSARQKMYNEALRDNRKVVELSVNEAKLQEGSILAMRKEVSALTAEYQRLSKEEREGAKGQELQKKLKGLNESINANMLAVSSFKDNIGNYMSALQGLGGPMASASSAFGVMQGSIGGVNGALKALMANPIVAAIALVVGILIKAAQAIKNNEELSNRLNVAFSALNPVIDLLTNALDKLAEGIVWVVEKFGDLVNWIAGTDTEAQKAIKSAQELTKAEQDLAKRKREFVIEQAKSESEISELKAKAADKERYNNQERLKFLDEAIAKETAIATERKAQAEERLRLLKLEADRAPNDAAANEELAQAQADVYRETKALNEKTRELTSARNEAINAMRAEAKAVKDAADAEAKAFEEANQRMLKANADAMQRVAQDAQNRLISESAKRLDLLISAEAEYDRIEEEAATLRFEKEMQLETERQAKITEINNNEILTEETKNAMLIELKLAFNIRLQEIDEEYTENLLRAKDIEDARVAKSLEKQAADFEKQKKREADAEKKYQNVKNSILQAGAVFSGAISEELAKQNKVAFEAKKAADIAAAVTSTYQAATSAYSAMAGIPYVGPALGAAAAAAAVASGVINVKNIAQQKYSEGGDSGTIAASTPTATASTPTATASADAATPYNVGNVSSLTSIGTLQTAGAVASSDNISNDIVTGVTTAIEQMPSPTLNIVEFQEAEENYNRKVELTE